MIPVALFFLMGGCVGFLIGLFKGIEIANDVHRKRREE